MQWIIKVVCKKMFMVINKSFINDDVWKMAFALLGVTAIFLLAFRTASYLLNNRRFRKKHLENPVSTHFGLPRDKWYFKHFVCRGWAKKKVP